jgi:DMSO reductase anchor subunit
MGAVMLAVAVINGWLAYEFGSKHPIMAFLHAVVAVAMVLGVVFGGKLDRPS